MRYFNFFFDLYLNSSLHVAFSVASLIKITYFVFDIPENCNVLLFAFFGTVVGYNFIKYDALARTQKLEMKAKMKAIVMVSFLSLFCSIYFFFQLQKTTQIIGSLVLTLILLYTLPFFPNKKNARNWAGIKIYMVTLSWVAVTLFLPFIDAERPLNWSFYLVVIQRSILVFVLVLIFEIIDLQYDDPHLKTVPQQIGIRATKIVGSILLIFFVFLEFLNPLFQSVSFFLKLGIATTTLLFLLFSNEKKSKYYTSFWVESIPIVWFLLLFLFQ